MYQEVQRKSETQIQYRLYSLGKIKLWSEWETNLYRYFDLLAPKVAWKEIGFEFIRVEWRHMSEVIALIPLQIQIFDFIWP